MEGMPLDAIDVPAIKAALLAKLDQAVTVGLPLTAMVENYALVAADIKELVRQLTDDDLLRYESAWRNEDKAIPIELTFKRGLGERA